MTKIKFIEARFFEISQDEREVRRRLGLAARFSLRLGEKLTQSV